MRYQRKTWNALRAGLVLGLALALGASACGPKGPRLTQLDAETLVERGMTAFQGKDWDEAIRYLERLSFVAPTHPRIAEVRYRLAQAHFAKKEYITAATEFGRLANEMPSDTLADDARWGVCRAYRRLSPDPPLDQEYTHSAIDHCDALVQLYPSSPYASQARDVVRQMRNRLAQKVYEGAEWYYRRKALDSAIIYYEDVLSRYADTPSAPASLLRLYQIYTELAYQEEATDARQRLLSEYPSSAEARQLRGGQTANGPTGEHRSDPPA